ncbi:hypothetical protein ABZ942_38950 [Nocardia sp. NPDC046473]|uniref:hypothetical protein n=1 Tax=Nocardia sp. NPDC046473 TaxID=3155733 RepID=UPI0033CBCE20
MPRHPQPHPFSKSASSLDTSNGGAGYDKGGSVARQRNTLRNIETTVAETGFSRYPVQASDGSLVGYLHAKDVLDMGADPEKGAESWRHNIRNPIR